MIKIKNITKTYHPDIHALRGVSLDIGAGEFVSIVGRSGAGKTTLLRMILADEKPTRGAIYVGGWDVAQIKQRDIPLLRRQMGVVFQDFKLLPQKTVFENVAFALEVRGEPHTKITSSVPQVLRIVGLDNMLYRYPRQLSGGEKQRVAIARALVNAPKILVADEPTGNLDSINTREIIDLLRQINKFGTTVLLVTHNREVVNSLHERVVTMENGNIISDKMGGKYAL